jgi:uncharacterized membrane protein YcaP (DUF421 family)
MEIVARASVIFFFLWLVTRAMGKRELSEMTAFELILMVIFGDLVQQGVTQEDMSVTGAMLAVGTIALWIMVFSLAGYRWTRARAAFDGVPVVVVRDGAPIEESLRLERLPLDELLESARKAGIDDLSRVRLGLLEPDGKFSFIEAGDKQQQSDAGGGESERHG